MKPVDTNSKAMSAANEPDTTDEKKRDLLLKLGKVALYTPPAMLLLMVSRKASAASLGSPPPPA